MHAYVVFAHPTKRSFTGAVLDALCRGLEQAGHTFETDPARRRASDRMEIHGAGIPDLLA